MEAKRLLKGADFLEKNARNKKGSKFDLDSWGECYIPRNNVEKKSGAYHYYNVKPDTQIELSCGTTACAFGSMAIAKLFPGLSYRFDSILEWQIDGEKIPAAIIPTYKGEEGFGAAEILFGISKEETEFLFDPGCYRDNKPTTGAVGELRVAKRIRQMVKTKLELEKIEKAKKAVLKKNKEYVEYVIDDEC